MPQPIEQHSVTGKAITSKFLSLVPHDFFKGLILAAIAPIVPIIGESINNWDWTFDTKSMYQASAAAMFAYLIKNFFEQTKTVIVVKPPITTPPDEQKVDVEVTPKPDE